MLKLGGRVAATAALQALELHDAGNEVDRRPRRRPADHGAIGRARDAGEVQWRSSLHGCSDTRGRARLVGCRRGRGLGGARPPAVPLVGDEIGLRARRLPELGFVGEPLPCRPPAVEAALVARRIPVVAPLAVGPLNVNADEAAAALAVGLEAERIVFVSDVPGVYVDGDVVDRLWPIARVSCSTRVCSRAVSCPSSSRPCARRGWESPPRSVRRRSPRDRPVPSTGADRLLPTYARADLTIVRGDGAGSGTTTAASISTSARGSPSSRSGICHPAPLAAAHAQLERLWHASNLYRTEPAEELASATFGAIRRRAGLLLQLGSRGDRGGDQVRAQGDGQSRRRRARGQLPRQNARCALGDRAVGEAGALRAARLGRELRGA